MFRSRLTTKVTLLIVLVLIIGFGVSTVLTIRRESALLVDEHKASARQLTTALIASIESAMLQERPDVTRVLIGELRRQFPVEQVTVYRRNGVEAFTDLTTMQEVERNAGLAPEVLANIRKMRREPGRVMSGAGFARALETRRTDEELEMRDGVPLFTLHRPILNQEKCQECHGSDHQVRAVVRMATSMAPVFEEVRHHRNRQIVIGVLTIVAAAGVLTLVMRQVVIRPIQDLAVVAGRLGEGDFDARARGGASNGPLRGCEIWRWPRSD